MTAAVDVLIVNYNAGEALLRCLDSVLEQGDDCRVIVVDNASTDGSPDLAEAAHGASARFHLIRNPDNPGLAVAVNRALDGRDDLSPWLLLLNPDCELRPGAVTSLRQALEADDDAALAGPRVVDGQGKTMRGTLRRFPDPWRSLMTFTGLWRLGGRMPALKGVEQDTTALAGTVPAEAVSGACMMVRSNDFLSVGGMDGQYGLHCEDLDLMYRLGQRGRHCLYVPSAVVYHQQGLSSQSRPVWVHWQKHRGMQRFFSKHQAGRYPLPVRWFVVAGIWIRFALTLPLVGLRR